MLLDKISPTCFGLRRWLGWSGSRRAGVPRRLIHQLVFSVALPSPCLCRSSVPKHIEVLHPGMEQGFSTDPTGIFFEYCASDPKTRYSRPRRAWGGNTRSTTHPELGHGGNPPGRYVDRQNTSGTSHEQSRYLPQSWSLIGITLAG